MFENSHKFAESYSLSTSQSLLTPSAVAVAGCGYWGKNLVRNFAELGALAAVCDFDMARAKQFGDQYGVKALTWQEVLDSPAVHAVVIAAPASRHYEMARQALVAGKDVMVEKPMALEVEHGQELCDIAEQNNRILMVGHLLHYHPAYRALKALVQDGQLGDIRYIYSNRLNLGKIRREEDILWSFAPHDVSLILDLMGEEPVRLSAEAGYYLSSTVADVTTTHLTFSRGRKAHIFLSWLHPFKEQKLIVVGDTAMAVFNDGEPWESKLQLYRHRVEIDENNVPTANKAEAENIELVQKEPLREECQHFLSAVSTRQTPLSDGHEGLRVLKVLHGLTKCIQRSSAAMPEGVFIHETAILDEGSTIGEGSKIWHFSHVLKGCRIGQNVTIGQNVMIGPEVDVGDQCKIQNNVSLYKGVSLAGGVFCGPSCVFTNVKNPRATIERKEEFLKTPVGKNATIGANATVICGVSIGEYAMIGAGAVVTKDVPAHAVVIGNPARISGWCSHAGEILGKDLVCPREGRRYKVVDNTLVEQIESRVHGKPQTAA